MYRAAGDLDQGSIIKSVRFLNEYQGRMAAVLTPTCDIAQSKADFLLLGAIALPSEVMKREKWKFNSDGTNELRRVMEWNQPRWHWLAPIGGLPDGGAVDFQLVASVPVRWVSETDIVAQMRTPYTEHLGQRFAAYLGRIGVDELEDKPARQTRARDIVRAINAIKG